MRLMVSICIIFLMSCSAQKKMTTPGFTPIVVEEVQASSSNFLKENLENTLVITPQSNYDSWRRMIYLNPDVDTYLVTPGDYRKWGEIRPSVSGTLERPKRIMRYDEAKQDVHPVHLARDRGDEVIIEGFNFNKISNWKIKGLTIRGQGLNKDGEVGGKPNLIYNGSHYIELEQCLIEEVLIANAVRISSSSYTIINNCVIRNKVPGFSGDNIAITVSATVNTVSRNTRITNNEIYNYTDGVQLVYYDTPSKNVPVTGEVPGTLIENNDIYITDDLHTNGGSLACAENAIDIKVGTTSRNPNDWIRITGNRMWGYRKTDKTCSGSANGDAVTIHINARNIILDNNVIFDSAKGITVGGADSKNQKKKVKNIAILNNLIFDLYNTSAENVSIAFITAANADIYGNSIKGCTKVLGNNSSSNHLNFDCNTFVDIKEDSDYQFVKSTSRSNNAWINYGTRKSKWNPRSKQHFSALKIDENLFDDYKFTIKRITAPEQVVVRNILSNRPIISTDKTEGCDVENMKDRWWSKIYD